MAQLRCNLPSRQGLRIIRYAPAWCLLMIDTHIHVAPPHLPGVGSLHPVLEAGPERTAAALRAEMQAAGVAQALAMGRRPHGDDDPLGVADTLAVARLVPGLH